MFSDVAITIAYFKLLKYFFVSASNRATQKKKIVLGITKKYHM